MKQQGRTILWLMVAVGVICMIVCAVASVYRWHFIYSAIRAEGKIVEMIPSEDREGNTRYSPVFTFPDANGIEHRVKCSWSSSPPNFKVGDSIIVLYPASNPEDAAINTWWALWGLSFVTGLLGAVFATLGFATPRIPWLGKLFGIRSGAAA